MQKTLVLILLTIFFSKGALAENNYFLMLKNNKVNVRYGPDLNSPIKYIYNKKNLPIKVIDKKENFRRIIDIKNNSGWIHTSQLRKNKSFILLENQILFSKPTKYSKPIVKISSGRLLLVKKCKLKWCRVKTENYTGWLEVKNVWGSIN
jgi:SH3-like domain-containing protein